MTVRSTAPSAHALALVDEMEEHRLVVVVVAELDGEHGSQARLELGRLARARRRSPTAARGRACRRRRAASARARSGRRRSAPPAWRRARRRPAAATATVSSGSPSSTAWASGVGARPSRGAIDCASSSSGTVPAAASSTRRHRRSRLAASAAGGCRRVCADHRGTSTSGSAEAAATSAAGAALDGVARLRLQPPAVAGLGDEVVVAAEDVAEPEHQSSDLGAPAAIAEEVQHHAVEDPVERARRRWRARGGGRAASACARRRRSRGRPRRRPRRPMRARPPGGGNPWATATTRTTR